MNRQTHTTMTDRNDPLTNDLENVYSTIESKTQQAAHTHSDNTGETDDVPLKNQIQPVEYVKQAKSKLREAQETLTVDTNEMDQKLLEAPTQLRIATIHHKDTQVNDEQTHAQICQACQCCYQIQTAPLKCNDCNYFLCSGCCISHLNHDMVIISNQEDHEAIYQKDERNLRLDEDLYEKCEKLNFCNYIDVSTHEDFDLCNIKGIAVSQNGEVAVTTDRKLYCIKVIDLQKNLVVRCILFDDRPWGITTISCHGSIPTEFGNRHVVAVTFPNLKEILVYDIDNREKLNTYSVFDECSEIVYHDDQFVTLCNRYKKYTKYYLNFLHKSGLTLKIIKLNIQPDRPLDGNKIYFALNPTKQIIYVSNFDRRSVLRFDFEGRLLDEYTFPYLQKPTGICIGEDQKVYVSFFSEVYNKSFIKKMSLDLAEMKSIFVQNHLRCEALTYCRGMFFTSLRNYYNRPTYALCAFTI